MAADPRLGLLPVPERLTHFFTDADTASLPEHYRYEIVDGMLLVSPRPSIPHQAMAALIFDQLREVRPSGLQVLWEVDFKPVEERTLVPDIVVAPQDAFSDKALVGVPLLLVEVRSPSSRAYDAVFKRELYAAAGVPTYWLVDPDQPALTVLELGDDGAYVETARLVGEREVVLTRPYPVTVRLR